MLITIHQPEHMPWGGFFHKMAQADAYVLLDSVQFKKNNWQNRNRIVDRTGAEQWLTVPVLLKGHTSSTIKETRIDNAQPWRRKYWTRIENSYRGHAFFDTYAGELESIIFTEHEWLRDLNYRIILFFRNVLGLNRKLMWSSDLAVSGRSTELLIAICQAMGATRYLAGADGKSYMEMGLFDVAGVAVEFHAFVPPAYPSKHFVPGLSTLDLLFSCGPESAKVLGIA